MGEFRSFYTMNLIYFLGLVILASVGAQEDKKIAGVRSPKIFYVSTKETSTTISTHTVCWVSSTTAATTCGRRRKRSVLEIDGDAPQRVKADLLREYEDNQKTVESGVKTDLDDDHQVLHLHLLHADLLRAERLLHPLRLALLPLWINWRFACRVLCCRKYG